MLGIIKKIAMVIEVLVIAYFIICYADILAHNLDFEPKYDHNWNVFVNLFLKNQLL